MTRIVDTVPDFTAFARRAFLESPSRREQLWVETYEGAHPDVFRAFYATQPEEEGARGNPLVRELSRVREQAEEGGRVMPQVIEDVEPAVRQALGLPATPAPLHVLLVGKMATNAVVGRLGEDVTLFHCLEWFESEEGSRVAVAHEDAHAWHEIALGQAPPGDDPAWMAFSEGLAIRTSRMVVSDRPEDHYFWYGHAGFEDWLPWCREHRSELFDLFRASVDDPAAVETFFGGGLVEGRWRVGYFLADEVVSGLERSLPELAQLTVEEGRAVVLEALGAA